LLQPLLLGGANSSRNVQQDPAVLELLKQFAGPVEAMKTTVTGWFEGLRMQPSSCCSRYKINHALYHTWYDIIYCTHMDKPFNDINS
jgi:hypothetical protein